MRRLATLLVSAWAVFAHADRILLVPLDSRPAAGQFAQMIGRIDGADVFMPPYDDLGRFTSPGKPDRILQWLADQDLSQVDAVIASADMIAYGGLIASRLPETPTPVAIARLQRLADIVNKKGVKLYVSSSTMRLAPTATMENRLWRRKLEQFMALRERIHRLNENYRKADLAKLMAQIPPREFNRYEAARRRNHEVQTNLIKMAANGRLDYLVIGQDDAQAFGPHVSETADLKNVVAKTGAAVRVYFSEGIDQHASLLVSRALLRKHEWLPRVRVVYSDPNRADNIANFESKPLRQSLADQILASGARVAEPGMAYDYTLFVNTANPDPNHFSKFMGELRSHIDLGHPAAIADVNLADDGTADARLFDALLAKDRMLKSIAYAGWNTAGNTLGTTIPTANVYLLAKRTSVDPTERELAHKEFLLHRYVDDYAYHKFTRPTAYRMLREGTGIKEESYGPTFDRVNDFVRQDVERRLSGYFNDQFMGRRLDAGAQDLVISGLRDVRVWLPWPRAYEVRLEFKLEGHSVMAVKR